jgi:hypothetical protein
VDIFFANLVAFARELNAEEQRHMAEKLREEELAVLDLLTTPTLDLTKDEREAVKQIAASSWRPSSASRSWCWTGANTSGREQTCV